MSATLSFTHHILAKGRELDRLGQGPAASRLLRRLASFRDLPRDVAEETHACLAEVYLRQGRLQKARRRLTAALACDPDNAHYHFLLAGAVEADEACAPDRALAHYRRCTRLQPDRAEYWCALGLLALELGQTSDGLKALRRAHELAPDDAEILGQVVQGLYDHCQSAEAKRLLKAAFFRHPRDPRFRALWAEHQFQLLYAKQRGSRAAAAPGQATPILLPFCRAKSDRPPTTGDKQIRRDPPSGIPAPKLPLRRRPTPGTSMQPRRNRGSRAE